MSAARWRGTLIYTGTLATIGTVAFARFGPLAQAEAPATAAGASSGSIGGAAPSVVGAPGSTSVAPGTGTDGSGTSATDPADPQTGTPQAETVTVVGSVAQTRYGPVQVQVTFTGSRLVDVRTLQAPSSHPESAQISARATPLLAREVLAAQSASIDTVSGATYTSEGYRESVQSILDQRG